MVNVEITEEKMTGDPKWHAGQKVSHEQLGRGIVVGFSSISGNPFVFFYEDWFNGKVVCLGESELTEIQSS